VHLVGFTLERNVYVELQDNLLKFCAVPFYVQKYMHVCVCACVREILNMLSLCYSMPISFLYILDFILV
jgi:hypothetical protein